MLEELPWTEDISEQTTGAPPEADLRGYVGHTTSHTHCGSFGSNPRMPSVCCSPKPVLITEDNVFLKEFLRLF
jgi:hypothetical protein